MDSEEAAKTRKVRTQRTVPRSWQARRLLWSIVEATLFRCSFHTFNRWRAFLLRLFGATIGPRCTIRRTVRIYYPWNLTIGGVTALGDSAVVYNLGPITLGDRVTISQEAYLCAGSHDYRKVSLPLLRPPITIGSDAWICARALVGPGVNVGEGAIVGAGAVAMREVPAWTIVAGNPAQFVKERPKPI